MKSLSIVQVIGDKAMTGVARHVLLLSKQLSKNGHSVHVIAAPGAAARAFKKEKIPCTIVRMRSLLDRRAYHKIRRIIASLKPDVVHCHGSKGGWLGRMAVRRLPKIAVVYSEHNLTREFNVNNPVWREFQLRSMALLSQFTDITIAASPAIKRFMVARSLSTKGRTVVVPCSIDPGYTRVRKYNKPDELPQIIGTIGSLNPHNGYFWLLEALAKLKKKEPKLAWRCQIIGDGPLLKQLRRKVRKLKLSKNVDIFSSVEDQLEGMRHFSVFVQYSVSESTGLRLLEAMALGVVPIVSNKGALADIVKTQENGLVVPLSKTDKLADALCQVLKNKKLRNKLSTKARRSVVGQYGVSKITERIELLYARALSIRKFKALQGK